MWFHSQKAILNLKWKITVVGKGIDFGSSFVDFKLFQKISQYYMYI